MCCISASWLLIYDPVGISSVMGGSGVKNTFKVIILVVVTAPLPKHGWVGWGFTFSPPFSKVRVAHFKLHTSDLKF